jgi:hypothetical protein
LEALAVAPWSPGPVLLLQLTRLCLSAAAAVSHRNATRYQEETRKAIESINAIFTHLGSAAGELLTDTNKLVMLVVGGSGLALGVYGAREGTRVAGKALERWLGTPKLVSGGGQGGWGVGAGELGTAARLCMLGCWHGCCCSSEHRGSVDQTSILTPSASRRPLCPLCHCHSPAVCCCAPQVRETSRRSLIRASNLVPAAKKTLDAVKRDFSDIILPGGLHDRVRSLAAAAANTKLHGAPYRHMLFYGACRGAGTGVCV